MTTEILTMRSVLKLVMAAGVVVSVAACGSMSTRDRDTVVGAGVGAAAGAAITGTTGGAIGGGVVGGVIGNQVGK
jgi:osmotically inducible lipoprotein OsmB